MQCVNLVSGTSSLFNSMNFVSVSLSDSARHIFFRLLILHSHRPYLRHSFTLSLKPTCFKHPSHHKLSSSFRTDSTDYRLDRIFWAISVLFIVIFLITFRVRSSRGEMCIDHGRLCVCVSVCLSVPRRIPTLLHGPWCNFGGMVGVPSSYAVLDRFAIGVWVSLLWQHRRM